MEQAEQAHRDTRRAMNVVSMAEIEEFSNKWIDAGVQTVQYWPRWERHAASFFGVDPADPEIMHRVMLLVRAVCHGSIEQVKAAVREASPSAIFTCQNLLGHLVPYSSVLVAELRFRGRELQTDWTLQADGTGRVLVRMEFRKDVVEQ